MGGKSIEKAEDYTYLEGNIWFSRGMEKEIEVREDQAWKSYWALKGIFKGDMSYKAKVKILESLLRVTHVNLRCTDMCPYKHIDGRTEKNTESNGAEHTKCETRRQH